MAETKLLEKQEETTRQNLVIRASAGTGKTYSLSNRFLQLVLSGVSIDRILATTFTRQAAREILDRILFRLAAAAESDDACRELAQAVGDPSIDRTTCHRALADLTSNLHRVRVSTLDAFFLRIAQSFSLELGLPPGWRIIDDSEAILNRERAIRRFLENDKTSDVLQLMHLLSKGEASRSVGQLVRDTVIDLHSLYLQSDKEAWSRIQRLEFPNDVLLEECLELLRHFEGLSPGMEKAKGDDLRRFANQQWDAFLATGLAKKIADDDLFFSRKEIPAELAALYATLIDHARAAVRSRTANQTEATYALLDRFDSHYLEQKHETRGLRFDDITTGLIHSFPVADAAMIAHRMNGTIDHLLLDEFQDTSLDQWQVLAPFAQRATAASGDRSFFCVGDTKQAIYGWRGGDADILDLMDRQLEDLQIQELSQSFRSSKTVIDFVNDVNAGLQDVAGLSDAQKRTFQKWCQAYPLHTTAKLDYPGYVAIETSRLKEDDGQDEKQIDLVLQRTAERVQEVHEQAPWADIAVLTRTNGGVAKTIFYLQQLGIPASEIGGSCLTDSAAVQLVVSLLRLADHPSDACAAFHLANSPWADALGFGASHFAGRASQLSTIVRDQLADRGYGQTIYAWSRQLRSFCNAREWRRLQQLTELAFKFQLKIEQPLQLGYSAQQRVSLRTWEFIQEIETVRVADPTANAVRVMTTHQSKGLQFDIVFVAELDATHQQTPNCVSRRPSTFERLDWVSKYVSKGNLKFFPKELAQMQDVYHCAQIRESLCVAYVALTRAVYGLHLMIAPRRSNGETAAKPTSTGGLILAALGKHSPSEPLHTVFACGDANWSERVAPKAVQPDPVGKTNTTWQTISLRSAAGRTAGAAALPPSTREGSGKVKLRHRLSQQSSRAMRQGSLIHAWFEQIEWIGPAATVEQRQIAFEMGFDPAQTAEILQRFQEMISAPQIQDLLSKETYLRSSRIRSIGPGDIAEVRVKNEQPIQACIDGGMMSGYIDRLVILFDSDGRAVAADIIDYKTDVIDGQPGRTLSEKTAHYRPQLEAYRTSLCQMLQLTQRQVTAALAFVQRGQVVDVFD